MTVSWKLKRNAQKILEREKGTVYKDPGAGVNVCVLYPNTYALAMANLGFQTVYHLFNSFENCVCERSFLPERDELEDFSKAPLFSLESQRALKEFDIIAFSIPFEEDYINIPSLLALAEIPVLSSRRSERDPLVIAGGIAPSLNPEPLADMMDLFVMGEAEGAVRGFLDLYIRAEDAGIKDREEFLREFDALPFVYVPSLYEFIYDGSVVREIKPLKGAKTSIRASKNLSLDAFPIPRNFVTTPDSAFKEASLIEIERGCGRGCRFCAAGFLCMPPRQRSMEEVKKAVLGGLEATGKAGLVGTAVSEYPGLKEVLREGIKKGGSMTLSSLRVDVLDGELIGLLKESGYRTVTFAPEAGSERMRKVVNKGIRDEEILEAVRAVVEAGFTRIKLYFLTGLPGESDADARAIAELAVEIKSIMKKGFLTLSINPFIPKPCTPFQWHGFCDAAVINKRLSLIKKALSKIPGVTIKAMNPAEAFFQAYISRADRRAAGLIMGASSMGMRSAIKGKKEFMEASVYRNREKDEILAWHMIDHGLKKGYLWNEYERGLKGLLTGPCNVGSCFRCGVCSPEFFKD
ncbi:MAG: radical SAM protein [Thermodesulfobacteriota bacterium]